MKPKMYIEFEPPKKEELPMPLLKITDTMEVVAVSSEGVYITAITSCSGYTFMALSALTAAKHRTDWAEWDESGQFVRLKEED